MPKILKYILRISVTTALKLLVPFKRHLNTMFQRPIYPDCFKRVAGKAKRIPLLLCQLIICIFLFSSISYRLIVVAILGSSEGSTCNRPGFHNWKWTCRDQNYYYMTITENIYSNIQLIRNYTFCYEGPYKYNNY